MALPLAQGMLPRLPQPRVADHMRPRRADSKSAGFPPPPPIPLLPPCCRPLGPAAPTAASPTAARTALQAAASQPSPIPPREAALPRRGNEHYTRGCWCRICVVPGPPTRQALPDDTHSVHRAYGDRYRHTIEVHRPLPTAHHLIYVPSFPLFLSVPLFFCFLFFLCSSLRHPMSGCLPIYSGISAATTVTAPPAGASS